MDGSPSAVPTVDSSDAGEPSAAVSNRAVELTGVDGSRLRHQRSLHPPLYPSNLLTSSAVYITPLARLRCHRLSSTDTPPLLCPCSHSTRRSRSGSGVVTPVATELADPMMLEAHVQHGSLSAAPNMASSSAGGALSTVSTVDSSITTGLITAPAPLFCHHIPPPCRHASALHYIPLLPHLTSTLTTVNNSDMHP